MKKFFVLCLFFLFLTGCGIKKETTTVTNEENIDIVSKNDKEKRNNVVHPSVKVVKKENDEEETKCDILNEEIYTNDPSDFIIEPPENIDVYSLISVKNVMSEDGKHGGALVPYITLDKTDNSFKFVFGTTGEYIREGTYSSNNSVLTLTSENDIYTFDYKENGIIRFNEQLSSNISVENERAYKIENGSAFFPMKDYRTSD